MNILIECGMTDVAAEFSLRHWPPYSSQSSLISPAPVHVVKEIRRVKVVTSLRIVSKQQFGHKENRKIHRERKLQPLYYIST